MYIKIALVILVLVSAYAGYSYFTRYDKEAANKIVQETEERNKKLQEQIDSIVRENATLKAAIMDSEFDKNNLRQEIENNKISIRNIKETNLVNRNRYVEKISSIATDTTNIYSRCLRMCESAENIGREFSCVVDFCRQFSVNSSATATK